MQTVETCKVCCAIPYNKYVTILSNDQSKPVFCTKSGDAGAYVETAASQFHKKLIRSTFCSILIPNNEILHESNLCEMCQKAEHYLRTLKSRKNKIISEECKQENSKYIRLDYLSRSELLQTARNSTKKLKTLKLQIKRLEDMKNKMLSVGGNTDNDFKYIFNDLYKGVKDKRVKLNDPVCIWKDCDSKELFLTPEELLSHVEEHIEITNISTAPINRQYTCCWEECEKTFKSKHLIKTHLREHTGNSSDGFFEILLKDQAKALNTPARQMRWHPLVIRWCWQMYSKSHSHYEDMRQSGFLKLPSGRTLNDYKNFSSASSGWQTSMLELMKSRFVTMKIGKQGLLGGLFVDEVKIKEGLVFDQVHLNW